jgi:opacity protein-like surface antigen
MKRLVAVSIVALALLAAAVAAAAAVHVTVQPGTVARGATLTVRTASSPCHPGDQVTLISSAFPGHAFGKGAVYGRVGARGAFTVHTHVRSTITAARYTITFRCGGGNLGVTSYVRIR